MGAENDNPPEEATSRMALAHERLDEAMKAHRVAEDLRAKGYRFYEADDIFDPIRFIVYRDGRFLRLALRPSEEADLIAIVTADGKVTYKGPPPKD
ncbi:MAG: hypothetical protein D6723_11205 [Acidobacteria bacterium]|nr:MAG: hypothetical protein D6723_11205 [Acidobacteriota bacterium]